MCDFNIKPRLKKIKVLPRKRKKKHFVKKRITEYLNGSDPMNELVSCDALFIIIVAHRTIKKNNMYCIFSPKNYTIFIPFNIRFSERIYITNFSQ